MKAAIYNPYLDTLGGGERYTMAFCGVLVKKGYDVHVQWKTPDIRQKLEKRFGINLETISFVKEINRGDGYDICFWVSDGSIPLLRARHNFLHFQMPFLKVNGKSLLNRMKFFRIEKIICNSNFTKKFIDQEYGVSSTVIYPPADTKEFKPWKKENLILYVGRFSELTQEKRQDVLVKVFRKFQKLELGNWKLVLAGGAEIGSDKFLAGIKRISRGLEIEIIESPSLTKLKELYGKSKLYWSASGYGVNVENNPQKVEHFGISVVEAMAAGCVPVVFDAGGFKEIIRDSENGFLWKKKSELLQKTISLINNPHQLKEISDNAQKSAGLFGYETFEEEIQKIL